MSTLTIAQIAKKAIDEIREKGNSVYLSVVVEAQKPDGSFRRSAEETCMANEQVFCMMALDMVSYDYDRYSAESYLVSLCNPDKGFGYGAYSDLATTSWCYTVLRQHGVYLEDTLNYIRENYNKSLDAGDIYDTFEWVKSPYSTDGERNAFYKKVGLSSTFFHGLGIPEGDPTYYKYEKDNMHRVYDSEGQELSLEFCNYEKGVCPKCHRVKPYKEHIHRPKYYVPDIVGKTHNIVCFCGEILNTEKCIAVNNKCIRCGAVYNPNNSDTSYHPEGDIFSKEATLNEIRE